jgi:chemotaxis protein CheX
MNVTFLNPFVEAANEVLRAEAQLSLTRGNLSLQKSALTTDDVTVLISIVGHVQGVVLYSLSNATGLALVSRMMSQEFVEFDSLAQSGVAELGNVITGRASVKLSEAGYESTISPPTMLLGKGATISTLDFGRLVVPLNSECGSVAIHLALREGVNRGLSAAALPVPARPVVGG